MKKIRKLTGEAAKQHDAKLKEGYVYPWINPINWVLADLRLRVMLIADIKPRYIHRRHRYAAEERRLLDYVMIGSYEGDFGEDSMLGKGKINDIRYKYLQFIYRSEFNRKHEWMRVTSNTKKDQVFVWHEDVERYYEQKAQDT